MYLTQMKIAITKAIAPEKPCILLLPLAVIALYCAWQVVGVIQGIWSDSVGAEAVRVTSPLPLNSHPAVGMIGTAAGEDGFGAVTVWERC